MVNKEIIIIALGILFLSGILIFINAQNEMTVEANFQGYGQEISMIVPDYINLGSFDTNNLWNETERLYINNTGGYKIEVTPELSEASPEIFNNLYFRKYTSSGNESLNIPRAIGNYSTIINAYSKSQFYMSLNLTDFNGTLPSDNININATIKFTATAIV